MKVQRWLVVGAFGFMCACQGSGPSSADTAKQAGLRVDLSATPVRGGGAGHGNVVGELAEIHVGIVAVAAHLAGSGWARIWEGPAVDVDLIRLADSAVELGFDAIPPGRVTQVRLFVATDPAPYAIDAGGARHSLATPSGVQSGIKLKGPFDIGDCALGIVHGAIDVERSIHVNRRGGAVEMSLRPVIRDVELVEVPAEDCATHEPDGEFPGDDDDDDDGEEPGTDRPSDEDGDGDVDLDDGADVDGDGDVDDDDEPLCYLEGSVVACPN